MSEEILGKYKKLYGLETNVEEVFKIIKPHAPKKYDDTEIRILADIVWNSIQRVQLHHIPDQTVFKSQLDGAIRSYENMLMQASYSTLMQKQIDKYKDKVRAYVAKLKK